MRTQVWGLAAGLALALAGGAAAQDHGHHPAHGATAPRGKAPAADMPATREYRAAHMAMMKAMDQPYTGDPDIDFRVQMIPHHQGAIDMARVALRHAKDPWTRQMAEAVIVEQQREIAEMRGWLAARGVKAEAGPQPYHVQGAGSFREREREPGTRDEARGQSWFPGAGIRAP